MKVTVIIPTYNERENLPLLARQILARPEYSLMVVDDQSPDGTGEVADGLAREFPGRVQVVHRTGRRGLGRSYIDAFKIAAASDADYVCHMDADFSHDPKYLPDLVAAAADHDLVIGSRYLHGVSVVNWPLRRLILSSFANRYIRAVIRFGARDCTSGFRCWRREAIGRIPLDGIASEGYSFVVEMLWEASRRGFRVCEVPIIFVERRQGKSKMSQRVIFESAIMPWRLLVRGLVDRHPESRA